MNKGGAGTVILTIIAILTLSAVGYMFVQTQRLQTQILQKTSQATPTPSDQSLETTPPLAQSPSPSPTPKSIVTFDASANIPITDKQELTKKVVNPFNDYYDELQGAGYIVSLTITKNTSASQDQYPYSAKAVFKSGATSSFLIMKDASGIAWWLPECLGGCNLSAAFKAKYPEIAAKVQ